MRERGLEIEPAERVAIALRRERQARRHLADVCHERIERTAHLTRIARHFGHALLVVVEFLERHHRQIDVVFLEAEERTRVVHQHVGIEHEQLAHLDFRLAALAPFVLHARFGGECGGWRRCRGGRFRARFPRGGFHGIAVIDVRRRHRLQERRRLFRATAARGRSGRFGFGFCFGFSRRALGAGECFAGDRMQRARCIGGGPRTADGARGRGVVGGFGFVAFCLLLRLFRRPGFGFVFFRRQEVAELGGGGRQRHGFPRKESGRISCAACRILLASRNTETVSAVCARRRASLSKTPVRLSFDRLLGSCLQRGHRAHQAQGVAFTRRKQKSRRPGHGDQRLDIDSEAPRTCRFRVARVHADRAERHVVAGATAGGMGWTGAHCEPI